MYEYQIEAITNEMIKACRYKYTPPIEPVRVIWLLEDGKFGKRADGEFDFWHVVYDKTTRKLQLRFMRGGTLTNYFFLNDDGSWKGKQRGTNGTCTLVLDNPPEREIWKILADTNKFEKQRLSLPQTTRLRNPNKEEIVEESAPIVQWKPEEYDLSTMIDVKLLPANTTAIGIVACDRPDYLVRTMQALAANESIKEYPKFLFLDHGGDPSVQEDQVVKASSILPGIITVKRKTNIGCGRNIIDARRQLFDNLGYDRAFIFEDDMIVSKSYLKLVSRLMDWANANYDNIGMVQGWNFNTMSLEDKMRNRSKVKATYTNMWGYLMTKVAWDKIKSIMYEYELLFLKSAYNERAHKSILEFFDKIQATAPAQVIHRPFPNTASRIEEMKKFLSSPPTGQDGMTNIALMSTMLARVALVVNRGLYIGEHGIHMSSKRFIQHGFNKIKLDEFPEDAALKEFDLQMEPTVESPRDDLIHMTGQDINES